MKTLIGVAVCCFMLSSSFPEANASNFSSGTGQANIAPDESETAVVLEKIENKLAELSHYQSQLQQLHSKLQELKNQSPTRLAKGATRDERKKYNEAVKRFQQTIKKLTQKIDKILGLIKKVTAEISKLQHVQLPQAQKNDAAKQNNND